MHCLSPFSNVGTTFGFFHSDGNLPERKQFWKIILSSLHMEMLQSFVMRMLIMSWPWALVGSRLFRTSLNRDSNTDVFLICEIFENTSGGCFWDICWTESEISNMFNALVFKSNFVPNFNPCLKRIEIYTQYWPLCNRRTRWASGVLWLAWRYF